MTHLLHRIATRQELIDQGLFSAHKLRKLRHRDQLLDRNGNTWQVIRKDRLKLEWHDYHGVKVLLQAVE